MRRVSNLAFNQEFPAASGLSGIRSESHVVLARDRHNPFDSDAVGVWLEGFPKIPLGWLYRKDTNRAVVLQALDQGKQLQGRVQLRAPNPRMREDRRSERQKVAVFWL